MNDFESNLEIIRECLKDLSYEEASGVIKMVAAKHAYELKEEEVALPGKVQ